MELQKAIRLIEKPAIAVTFSTSMMAVWEAFIIKATESYSLYQFWEVWVVVDSSNHRSVNSGLDGVCR